MPANSPLEQLLEVATPRRYLSLGIPAPRGDKRHRFTLTPEAVGILAASGIEIKMQAGAGQAIHYTDARYAAAGARITDRQTAFACDIVLHLPPVDLPDIRLMRRGALLLTLLNPTSFSPQAIEALVQRSVISLALDLVADREGHLPFADILNEIYGNAAITLAAGALADPGTGKGILLGNIPGIVPCEIAVFGASIAGQAAAKAALATGATVRLFDDDTYALREALRELPLPVIASVPSPRAVASALRTADIIVVTTTLDNTAPGVDNMKQGAIIFDLNDDERRVFPSLPTVDIATATGSIPHTLTDAEGNPTRTVFTNPGAAVPRSCAMAVSNAFVTMIRDILTCDGINNAIKLNAGMQRAVLTFLGRLTNSTLARRCALRYIDIHILVQFS